MSSKSLLIGRRCLYRDAERFVSWALQKATQIEGIAAHSQQSYWGRNEADLERRHAEPSEAHVADCNGSRGVPGVNRRAEHLYQKERAEIQNAVRKSDA
jgi:hypothetical protein